MSTRDDTHWTNFAIDVIQEDDVPLHLTLCGIEIHAYPHEDDKGVIDIDVRYLGETVEKFQQYGPVYPDVSCTACLLIKFSQGAEALERD